MITAESGPPPLPSAAGHHDRTPPRTSSPLPRDGATARHASVPPPGAGAWTTRVGEACVLGLAVASLAAVPTALRTARAGASFLEGLLVGAAVLLPLVTLALILARAAGRGFRGIVGPSSKQLAVLRIALWIGVAVPALAALGALLKALTHHRGLAGATFGVLGLAVVATAALVAHRLVLLGERLAARGVKPWILAIAGAALGVLPLLAALSPLAQGVGARGADPGAAASIVTGAAVRAAIVDGAIVLVATALVSTVDLGASARRIAGLAGVPLAAVVLIAATARLESAPSLGQAVCAGGGLAATLLGALERWTDRDGDGMGAHFGGLDCDEGDPGRHAGAHEIPGDGVDQDCNGADLPGREGGLRAIALAAPLPAADAVNAGSRPMPAAGPAKAGPRPTLPAPLAHAPSAAPPESGPAPAATGVATVGGRPRRDVILVTLDTVRADHTSAYGYARDTTPRLAALAKRSVLFERAYATSSETQRALSPVVTGLRLNHAARDRRAWPTLLPENDTVAERMKRAGYLTAAVSSFTWISQERGFDQGFDRFETVFDKAHPEREATGELAVQKAIEILKDYAPRAQPVYLWIHLFDAHERYIRHPGIDFGKGMTASYDGEIAYVDRQLGALFDAVAASPRAERTAILVHGSHGEALGEHGTLGHGVEVYEEAVRVPLIVALPGAAPGRYARPVSTADIAPTVLALGEADAKGVEGDSLAAIAAGDLSAPHGPVFVRTSRRAALVDGGLKLHVMKRKKRDRLVLFDVLEDPGETKDLSDARPDERERLLKMLSAFEPQEQ